MARKRKRNREEYDELETSRRPRRRKGKFFRRFMVLTILLLAVAAALPTIVSQTPARDTLLGWAMPDPSWSVTSGDASFAWMGSQTLGNLRIVDAEGTPLATVERISLDRSLLALVTNQSDLGKIIIHQPTATLVTHPQGSNLEDMLTQFSGGQSSESEQATVDASSTPSMEIEVVGGTVHGHDVATKRNWTLAKLDLSALVGPNVPGGVATTCTGELTVDDQPQVGRLNLRMQQSSPNETEVNLLTEDLPLEPLQPWLARVLPGAWLNGRASTDAQVTIGTDDQGQTSLSSTGRLEGSQISLQADAIAGDRIQFQTLNAPWELSLQNDEIHFQRLNIVSDWAQVNLQGTFNLADLGTLNLQHLPRSPNGLAGKVQLQTLAAMLPNTLQLRQGVWIDSGDLEFQAGTNSADEGFAWTLAATISNVVGNDGRRAIRWTEPIEAKMALADSSGGPQLKNVSLVSPFAEANLESTRERVDGSFQFDLQKLSDELAKFVDLDDWHFQGRGEGTLEFVPTKDDQFRAGAELKLTELNVAKSNNLVWAEPQLKVTLNAGGTAVDFQPRQFSSFTAELRGARDRFDTELLQPISLEAASPTLNLSVEAAGPLASWAGRLRPWVDAMPEQLEGEAQLQAKLISAPGYVQVVECSGRLTNLQLRKEAMQIVEPRVEFAGDFRWDQEAGNLASREATFQSSTVTFRSADILLKLAEGAVPTARGGMAFRADLERLSSALGLIGGRDASWARGNAVGRMKLSSDGSLVKANISTDVDQLAIVRAGGTGAAGVQPQIAWSEPKLQTVVDLNYDVNADRMAVDKISLTGQTLRVDGTAKVEKLTSDGLVQASGALQYDSEALAQLLATYLGPEVQLQGDRQVRFQVAGQLADGSGQSQDWSKLWSASAEAGWNTADIFGLEVGGGKLQGTLRDGQLQIAPLDVAVGHGRLTARPVAYLSPGAEQIVLPRGPLISNVSISPEVSEAMLKYVAPILAGATRAQGQFSLDLENTQVPLAVPEQARVTGKLEVHQLRVTPGPMLNDLASLISQLESLTQSDRLLQSATTPSEVKLLSMTDQQIQFQVAQGRVYHRDLQFTIDDVPVRSNGSVGFDQTLAMELDVPIQRKWLGDKRAFQSLAGQVLKIPITGTFDNPRLDSSAVANLSQQLLQGAASQVIGDELNRAFDKLFK